MPTLTDFLNLSRKPLATPSTSVSPRQAHYAPLLGLWLIDIALLLDWPHKRSRSSLATTFTDIDFIELTGLSEFRQLLPDNEEVQDEDDELDELFGELKPGRRQASSKRATTRDLQVKLLKRLKARRQVLLQQVEQNMRGDLPLFQNVDRLGRLLNLVPAEKAVLTFAACLSCFDRLKDAITPNVTQISNADIIRLVARLTGQAEPEVRKALRRDGVLLSAGLVNLDADEVDLENKLTLLNELRGVMLDELASDDELNRRVLRVASPGHLSLADFPHLTSEVHLLCDYLNGSRDGQEQGANILLYGPPGTGKTELAKAIATELGIALYEIAHADPHGEPLPGEQRLSSLNFCQRTLQGRPGVAILFDEVEDVLPGAPGTGGLFGLLSGQGNRGADKAGKAWINRCLEENPVPTVWITNNADIDPAYLRRFDYSLALRVPPRTVLARIAREYLGDYAPSAAVLDAVAEQSDLLPAQLERAARVARITARSRPELAWQRAEMALTRSRSLLGQTQVNLKPHLHTGYSLALLNTDADVSKILKGLEQRPQASFCLYGPPGTGKSLLARHVADALGKPLIIKRASDLLDKYLGETEQRIAAMFTQAREEDAVLVLDEADSFLADRAGARHAWEVTQTNELLTQLECFEGIFFATTNLMDRLDAASVRRFSHKIRFDYLTSDQRWAFFQQEVVRLDGCLDEAQPLETAVRRLDSLAPGDFAAVLRRLRLHGETPGRPSCSTNLAANSPPSARARQRLDLFDHAFISRYR